MSDLTMDICSICQTERVAMAEWFLVGESAWEDRLQVFCWDDQLASKPFTHRVCSPNHVRELVVHWMTTGSLDYPFATVGPSPRFRRRGTLLLERKDPRNAQLSPIGELAVHRESLGRALSENPQSLNLILDELLYAVRREWRGSVPNQEEENRIVNIPTRSI